MGKSIKIIISIIVVIVVAGLAFYAGSFKASGGPSSQMNYPLGSGGDNQMAKVGQQKLSPENMIQGQVTDISNQDITILLADGTSKKILLSGNTRIGKVVTGTLSDVVLGSSLVINGSENLDGSVSAQIIQIRMQAPSGQKPPRNQTN